MPPAHPFIALAALPLLALPVIAQPDEAATTERILPDDGRSAFSLRFAPGAFFARMSGDVTFGPSSTPSFTLENTLDLDDLEISFNGELLFRKNRFDVLLTGFEFSTSGTTTLPEAIRFGGLALDTGDRVRGAFDLFSASLEARYAFFPAPDADEDVSFRISPTLGLRYIDLDHALTEIGGARERIAASSVTLMGGLAIEIGFRDWLLLEAGAAFGPSLDGDGSVFQIGATFTFFITPNAGVSIGYRQLDLVLEEGEYEFDGRLAGLVLAASIRF